MSSTVQGLWNVEARVLQRRRKQDADDIPLRKCPVQFGLPEDLEQVDDLLVLTTEIHASDSTRGRAVKPGSTRPERLRKWAWTELSREDRRGHGRPAGARGDINVIGASRHGAEGT